MGYGQVSNRKFWEDTQILIVYNFNGYYPLKFFHIEYDPYFLIDGKITLQTNLLKSLANGASLDIIRPYILILKYKPLYHRMAQIVISFSD